MALGGDPQHHRRIQVCIEIAQSLPTMDTKEKTPDFPSEVRIFLAELGEAVKEYLEKRRRGGVGDDRGEAGEDGDRDESSGILQDE